MAIRIKYEGNITTKRYPRTLEEAFPRHAPLWREPARPNPIAVALEWASVLACTLLFLSIFFTPDFWRNLSA